MDKRMVISAYRRGFISLQECAQILGIDSLQIMGLINDPKESDANTHITRISSRHVIH